MDSGVTHPGAGTLPTPPDSISRLRVFRFRLPIVGLLILSAFGVYFLHYDLRSYSLLVHFLDPQATGPILRWETYAVTIQEVVLPGESGPVPVRLYLPIGVRHPPGLVVVHGIHRLGMNEPRLVSFSQAAAGNGFAVLTPELSALADYHVDAASIPAIGESAVWLRRKLDTGAVTIVGISFGGGLSLLAALDPRYAPHIRALVLMGAYDDLSRVSRFLATSRVELPDGRSIPFAAHDYGAAVFVYAHLAQFFPPRDLPLAREALRDWLWEQPQNAQPLIAKLSSAGRALMQKLLARQIDLLRPQLLDAIHADRAQLDAISPHGQLGNLQVPVYILHGSTDNIIPSSESLWLEKEIPARYLRETLITPAFSHVDPDKRAGWFEEMKLVQFLANVLRASS